MGERATRIRRIGVGASLVTLLSLLHAEVARAGGNHVRLESVRINGVAPDQPVPPRELTKLCYTGESYLYSGHQTEYAYMVMAIRRNLEISDSVGRGGKNAPADVESIQQILRKADYYRGEIDGIPSNELDSAIAEFQRRGMGGTPDSRIDVRGRTLRALRDLTVETLVLSGKKEIGSHGPQHLVDCVAFVSPAQPGSYEIAYSQLPLIVAHPVGREMSEDGATVVVLGKFDHDIVEEHVRQYGMTRLSSLRVGHGPATAKYPFATYLKINDKFPTVDFQVPEGNSDVPVRFQWHTRPTNETAEHRFRLYPDQSEWSPWGRINKSEYYFIGAGSHSFEVESRFREQDGELKQTPRAYYEFTLEKPFVSKPTISKARRGQVGDAPAPDLTDLYSRSTALIVGIDTFQDPTLSPLPYIDEDVAAMEIAMRRLGFKVETLKGGITRNQIIGRLESDISTLGERDRFVVYFSTHGFQDETVKSKGYLASADCDTRRPNVNCIPLDTLEDLVKGAAARNVKHVLVLLDSCSSGLGVISKSPEYAELHIATQDGTHIITAGMADQQAQMDNALQMSTFTHYLTEGLKGGADYTHDGVVSLTELLLYVRYQVATKTSGAQTPMMGRISGAGEMIFDLRDH